VTPVNDLVPKASGTEGRASRQLLVADCTHRSLRLGVYDEKGKSIGRTVIPVDLAADPRFVARTIAAGFNAIDVASNTPLICVVGLPARIAGSLTATSMPGWSGIAIASDLEEVLGCRVIVERSAVLRSLGEAQTGRSDNGPFLYVDIDLGITAAVVTQSGRTLHGAQGLAGEIGHIPVSGERASCACGSIGCLDTVASGAAMARRMNGLESTAAVTSSDVDRFRALVALGDREAQREIRQAGLSIGFVIAGLALVLAPRRIVLGGVLITDGEELLVAVRDGFATRLARRAVDLRSVDRPESAGLDGGLALALEVVRGSRRDQPGIRSRGRV